MKSFLFYAACAAAYNLLTALFLGSPDALTQFAGVLLFVAGVFSIPALLIAVAYKKVIKKV